MRIFHIIRSSVFDPVFYATMRDRSWSEGARYYAVIAFIIVFAYLSPLWALLLTVSPDMVDRVTAVYPDALEVTLSHGSLFVNQPQPYRIPNTFSKDLPDNLVVFDTENDAFSPTALSDAQTLILFKKTFAITVNSNSTTLNTSEQRVFSYGTSTGTSTTTKAQIASMAETVKPYVRPVAIFGGAVLFVLSVLLGGIGMVAFHLIYILFPALFVFLYFKIRSQHDTYRTAYVTTLFASIPVAIMSAFAGLFGGLPLFMYTLLLLILVIINLTHLPKGVHTA